ncbi:MAG: hypothetical protein PHU43_05865 [Candidatus Bipolaricaulis sp.]|nr:hypothetical protein [Candidatus Bipolaricaulis sp.]
MKTGAKLVAECLVNKRDIEWVKRLVEDEGCSLEIDNLGDDADFVDVHIVGSELGRQLVCEVKERGAPKGALDTWINGKLFGYSDAEISRFLFGAGRADTAS